MRNKMITLCPTTYEIAQKIPNFSGWIRKILLNPDAALEDADYLREANARLNQLLRDIINGKKVWVESKGWIKNMYDDKD